MAALTCVVGEVRYLRSQSRGGAAVELVAGVGQLHRQHKVGWVEGAWPHSGHVVEVC